MLFDITRSNYIITIDEESYNALKNMVYGFQGSFDIGGDCWSNAQLEIFHAFGVKTFKESYSEND